MYDIYEFTYKSKYKSLGMELVVYARTKEIADKIIDVANQHSSFIWKRKIFGFKKKIKIDTPPYEVELEEIKDEEDRLRYRIAHGKNPPEKRPIVVDENWLQQ